MAYNNTSVASKGMTLEEADKIISRIEQECDIDIEDIGETRIGRQAKFITFSAKIDNEQRAKRIIEKIESDYGLGYVDIKKKRRKRQVEQVNFSVSIKIDDGNGRS